MKLLHHQTEYCLMGSSYGAGCNASMSRHALARRSTGANIAPGYFDGTDDAEEKMKQMRPLTQRAQKRRTSPRILVITSKHLVELLCSWSFVEHSSCIAGVREAGFWAWVSEQCGKFSKN
jgi:hypothetical protein